MPSSKKSKKQKQATFKRVQDFPTHSGFYSGNVRNKNTLHGFGQLNFPNSGSRYVGYFQNNLPTFGANLHTNTNKMQLVMLGNHNRNNGSLTGNGIETLENGGLYIGSFKKGKRHGYGIFVKNGEIIDSGYFHYNSRIQLPNYSVSYNNNQFPTKHTRQSKISLDNLQSAVNNLIVSLRLHS